VPAVALNGHAMVGVKCTGDPTFVLEADHELKYFKNSSSYKIKEKGLHNFLLFARLG